MRVLRVVTVVVAVAVDGGVDPPLHKFFGGFLSGGVPPERQQQDDCSIAGVVGMFSSVSCSC